MARTASGKRKPNPLAKGLYVAAKEGKVTKLRELLAAGVPVDAVKKGTENLFGVVEGSGTALGTAAEGGYLAAVRLLLEAGADVDAPDGNFATPLMQAAAPGHIEVVQALLDAGARVDACENGKRTALSFAAYAGNTEVVQLLLRHGAKPNTPTRPKAPPCTTPSASAGKRPCGPC